MNNGHAGPSFDPRGAPQPRRRGVWGAALALLLGALASPLAAQRAAQPAAEALAGEYVVADAAAAERARDAAIARVVERMNFVVRGIARRRLTEGTPIHPRIRIVARGAELRVVLGTTYAFRARPGGPARPFVDAFGNELRGTVTRRDGGLALVFRGDSAVVRHTLTATEERLILQVRIESDRLPAPVTYRARYRRVR